MDKENVMSHKTSGQKDCQKKYLTFQQRLQTFENWPLTSVISPQQLALAGFYYLQRKDMVECIYCKGVFMNWKPGDDPESEHKLYFPHCDFLHQEKEKNNTKNVKSEIKNSFGSLRHVPPKYPQYALHEKRLQTFTNWPNELKQTPEMLAEAGFYYVGPEDYVRCFYCGGGLNKWEQEDNVWKEHAQWFSYCGFVNLVQGSQFVKRCIDTRPSLNSLIATRASDSSTEVNIIKRPVSQFATPTTSTNVSVLQFSEPDTLIERLTDIDLATNNIETKLYTTLISRVKETLKRRQKLGEPYMNVEQFIEDVLSNQTVENTARLDSNSPEFIHLLNQLIQAADNSISKNTPESDALLKSRLEKEEMDNKPDIKFLEEENRKLKEDRLCKICMDCALAIVFLPCGHLATCFNCAPILTNCPMCRQWIRGCIRIFLS